MKTWHRINPVGPLDSRHVIFIPSSQYITQGGRIIVWIYRHINRLIKIQLLIVWLQFIRVVLWTILSQKQNIAQAPKGWVSWMRRATWRRILNDPSWSIAIWLCIGGRSFNLLCKLAPKIQILHATIGLAWPHWFAFILFWLYRIFLSETVFY